MTAKIKTAAYNRYKHKPKRTSHRDYDKVYWPYIPLIAAISLLLVFGGRSGMLQVAAFNPGAKVLAYATSMSRDSLLVDTNAQRSAHGKKALTINTQLNSAAQAKAKDMAKKNYWSHNTPDGDPPWVFVTATGYSYQKLGENLAAGFSSAQSTIDGWMASPPHRENLLDSDYTEVGFGYANNPDYTSAGGGPMTIVVAFYGKPTGAAPTPTPSHVASSKPASSTPTPAPTNHSSSKSSSKPTKKAPKSQPQEDTAPVEQKPQEQPINTQNENTGTTLAIHTSRAQLAFAQLPLSSFAAGFMFFGAIAALGLIISRHAVSLRRTFARGEAFVFRHPWMDVGLLILALLSFVLSRSAGNIL